MSGTTSVPAPYFGPAGFVAPAETDILNGVLADMNAAFGGNLNITNLQTPQGQLASTIAAIVADKNYKFLQIASACDPAYATGRYQDALARIYFLERAPAQPSVIQVTCIGAQGVGIAPGARLQDSVGNNWFYLPQPYGVATFDATGTMTLPFTSVPGPIPTPVGVMQIQSVTFGWDTATSLGGVLGTDVESRASFELRRQISVARNAAGTLPAIQAAVLAVPNVLDCYVSENFTSADVTTGGVTIKKNSLYVCVFGGNVPAPGGYEQTTPYADNGEIATAIWSKKPPGCGYTGDTTVSVLDTTYPAPCPSYNVTFQSPFITPISIQVSIFSSTAVPADALTQITPAIISAFAGEDGGPRPRIGSRINASRFYAAVAGLGSWAQIDSIKLTSNGGSFTDYVQMNINQAPAINATNITLVLV